MCDGKGSPSFDGLRTLAIHHQSALLTEVTLGGRQAIPKHATPQHSRYSTHQSSNQQQNEEHETTIAIPLSARNRSPTPEVICNAIGSKCSSNGGSTERLPISRSCSVKNAVTESEEDLNEKALSAAIAAVVAALHKDVSIFSTGIYFPCKLSTNTRLW